MTENFLLKIEKFLGLCTLPDEKENLPVGQSPYMLNFRVNENYLLEKREGFVPLFRPDAPIRGFFAGRFSGKNYYLAVAGKDLYCSETGFDRMEKTEGEVPGEEKVVFFSFYDGIYLLTGCGIRRFDGTGVSLIEPYVPTVMISTEPSGAGVMFEEANLLTKKVKQSFSPDGRATHFIPFTRNIKELISVELNGEMLPDTEYYYDEFSFHIVLVNTPKEGTDTLVATFELFGEDVSDRIGNCRFAVGFGGANDTRVFLYGNRDTPAMRYHSGVVDGKPGFSYFPELGYTLVGSGAPITSIVRHFDRQLIFTEDAAYYSYLEYRTGALDRLIASFPVLPLSDGCGCSPEGQALLVENFPHTLTRTGLFRWNTTSIRDERNAEQISRFISHALQKENAAQALLFYRKAKSELFLSFAGRVFVYQVKTGVFYYYELPEITGFSELETRFYFATENGIFEMKGETDDGEPIPVSWHSGTFSFSDAEREKNIYGLTLLCEAAQNTSVNLFLAGENGEGAMEKNVILPLGKDISTGFLRLPLRRVRLFKVRFRSEENGSLLIRGLRVKGRMMKK